MTNEEASTAAIVQVEEPLKPHSTEVRTIVFTDIVGSTRLKQALGDQEGVALIQRHHALLRTVLAKFADGQEIFTSGDGFLLLFNRPSEAVSFALRLQRAVREFNRDAPYKAEDRIGINAGEVVLERGGGALLLQGIQIDTASRVTSLAGADQILLTRFAFDNARQMLRTPELPESHDLSWLSHGHYEVDGVDEPIEVCEVGERPGARLSPPTESAKARRRTQSDGTLVLGWRPAVGENVPGSAWRLERKLGEGGFGEVWLALHAQLRQRRVFKFCFFADRARSLKREVTLFRVLAERVRDHPNIVRVGDVFLDAPPYYLSMEYVPGEDLIKWAESCGGVGALSGKCKLEIVAEIADGLAAAHSAGVLHRDVKPSNILIEATPDGCIRPKLTDFGIGQIVSQEILAGMTGIGFTRTIVGSEKEWSGTRLYMAPELLSGQGATPQSDIYSLGVILYQLLINDFQRPVTTDWSRRVVDPLLREDLNRCFVGDPAERFTGAAEFAASLRALAERRQQKVDAEAEAARRERTAYRRGVYRAAGVAGVIVTIVLVVAASAVFFARKARENSRRNEAILDFMLQDLRVKLEPSGRREVLLALSERVLKNQRELNSAGNGNVGGLLREANALILRGDIQVYRGLPKEARADYEEARTALAKVPQSDPASLPARRLTGGLGHKLSDVEFLLGDEEVARVLADQSRLELTHLLKTADREGASPPRADGMTRSGDMELARLKRDVGFAVTKAAGYRSGNEQEELYREGLRLRQEAFSAAPDQVQWRFEIAGSWYALGQAARMTGSRDVASTALRKCEEIVSELLVGAPANVAWRHLLAKIAIERALLSQQWSTASELLGGAIRILEQVRIADPGNVWWQQDLADAHALYAEHLDAVEKKREGELQRSAARALREELSKAHPDVVIWTKGNSQHLAFSSPPPTLSDESKSLPDGEIARGDFRGPPTNPRGEQPAPKIDRWNEDAKLADQAIARARMSLASEDINAAETALAEVPSTFSNLAEVVVLQERVARKRHAISAPAPAKLETPRPIERTQKSAIADPPHTPTKPSRQQKKGEPGDLPRTRLPTGAPPGS